MKVGSRIIKLMILATPNGRRRTTAVFGHTFRLCPSHHALLSLFRDPNTAEKVKLKASSAIFAVYLSNLSERVGRNDCIHRIDCRVESDIFTQNWAVDYMYYDRPVAGLSVVLTTPITWLVTYAMGKINHGRPPDG